MHGEYEVIENEKQSLDDEQEQIFKPIKAQLTVKAGKRRLLRVFPQKDQQNRDDYVYIMGSDQDAFLNLISIDMNRPANIGKRRICKAYRFFQSAVSKYAENHAQNYFPTSLDAVFDVLAKVNAATFVRILSPTRDSANKLFEALNNRGVQLTITDLIKNHLLSKFNDDTEANKKWREAVKIFSRDGSEIPAGEQKRFFRQTHNAYRYSWNKSIKLTVAKRANLYEDLRRINESTGYVLLLYLLKNRDELKSADDDLKTTILKLSCAATFMTAQAPITIFVSAGVAHQRNFFMMI